jgi:hypothetical protein
MAISSIKKAASNLSRARKSIGTSGAAPKAVTSAYVDPSQVYGDKGQNFDAKVLSTPKFGDLVLDGSEFVIGGKELAISGEEALARGYENLPYKATNLSLKINGQTYTFHPKNILEKGFVADGKQFYNPNVLKNLDQIYEQGQAVNLKDVGWYDDFLKKNDLSTEGILLPAGELNFTVGSGGGYKVQKIGNPTSDGRVLLNEITGIGKVGDQYVYTTDVTKVDATDASGYYDQSGQGRAEWTKERGGLLGSASRAVAKVPFLPEIAGAATQNPYVYATLKGLQGGATGQDPLKVGLKAGATILAADLASGLLKGTPAGVEGGTGAFDADVGGISDAMTGGGVPRGTMSAAQLSASNIDPSILETMSAEQVAQAGINSPYYAAAQSNIDPLLLEGMSAQQVATAPVLTTAALTPAIAAGSISLSDAFRGARAASSINNLLNPPSAGEGGVDQGGAQPTMAGVDYSGLYNLLAQRSPTGGLLGTQYQPQPLNLASLLG